jgi:hypothetical protein
LSFKTLPYFVVENFNPYDGDTLSTVWIDGAGGNGTQSWLYLKRGLDDANLVRGGTDSNSIMYVYNNDTSPFYSEVYADIATLGDDPDWLGFGAKSLSLWFRGQLANPTTEPMYVKLTDGDSHTVQVTYAGDVEALREPWWHEWNIDLQDFVDDNPSVDLTNVSRLIIGFGDGGGSGTDGYMYFEDIRLYVTRCVPEYGPAGDITGGEGVPDCVVDFWDLKIMAETWLYGDYFIHTQNPGEADCVAYWPMDEGNGNKIYSHPKFITYPDFCDTNWTGTFNVSDVTWVTPGAGIQGKEDPNYTLHFNVTSGVRCGRHIPATNGLTLAIWAKWAGQRRLDNPNYCYKPQGIFSERGGWSPCCVRFMFECDTFGNGTFALRQHGHCHDDLYYCTECCNGDPPSWCDNGYGHDCDTYYNTDVYAPDNILIPYIGQWVHLAATFDGSIARLYLNGGEVASGPFSFGYLYDLCCEPATLKIGENQVAYEVFGGDLDEAYIFNRALTQAEIGYLADTTPGGDGGLYVPVPSPANVYDGNEIPPYVGEQPQGQRSVNFKDFAIMANQWLEEELWPYEQ